jgi:hypothetical protein
MRKYTLYAIGEIALVVIGILIALSINNWNEERKVGEFERKVLSGILVDVDSDLEEMNRALDYLRNSQNSCNIILNNFKSDVAYHDSMDIHFALALMLWSLTPNSIAFENAKSEGIYLIRNDSIRFLVSKVNQYFLDYIRVLENRWQDYTYTIVIPHCTPLFELIHHNKMPPLKYSHLQLDSVYLNILKTMRGMRNKYIGQMKVRHELLENLRLLIKKELSL